MEQEYYSMSVELTKEALKTNTQKGLSNQEVYKRQKIYGPNQLPQRKKGSIPGLFLRQFNDFMVLVLLAATFVSTLLGHLDDAVVILLIVILNGLLGFIQEYRAEQALENLKRLSAPTVLVKRGGKINTIPMEELVPGDLIPLTAGQFVPADARVILSRGLKVDESSLTGESFTIRKDPSPIKEGVPLGDRTCMLYKGTVVVEGRGEALVTAIGKGTEMGHIAHLIQEGEEGLTPLQWRLKKLGYWLVSLCLGACFLLVGMGIWQGKSIYQMFMAGVSLAVAAIPEGLPAIVTLSLALGVQRMIKKKAIVRRLPAVETLGCATVICADKTGTLTLNKMSLYCIYVDDNTYTTFSEGVHIALLTGLLCNNTHEEGDRLVGDPTEVALYQGALLEGIDGAPYRREDEIPFSPKRKMMSVLVTYRGEREIYSKGAPKSILDHCSHYLYKGQVYPLTTQDQNKFLGVAKNWGRQALRVLALAYSPLKGGEPFREKNLIFIGFAGLMDPPRPEVREAIRTCKRAGIKPVMITGDHKETAVSIARKIGLMGKEDQVMEGEEIQGEEDLISSLGNVSVFARVTPKDKLRLVKAYQKQGQVVAMTGDGINDAPAVKAADIGIAMGKMGTDVTREVSSLVLADDHFATIVAAVEEGRGIYQNIRKFIRYLLSCNIGEILVVLLAMLIGKPLPLIPIQILWVNLVTDGLPALALGMEPIEEGIMEKGPRDPKETIFSHGLKGKILVLGTAIGLCTLVVFLISLLWGVNLDQARTMAFTTLVVYQLLFVFCCRSEERPLWRINLVGNKYLVMAVLCSLFLHLLVIYHPFMSSLFKTTPLNLREWMIIIFFPLLVILLVDMGEYTLSAISFPKLQGRMEP